LPLGCCSTSTAVMVLPLTVSCTCTGPHSVWATSPVTVVAAGVDFLWVEPDPLVVEPEPLLEPLESLEPLEPVEPVEALPAVLLDTIEVGALVARVEDVEVW